jgi:C-terminal processing protease CtpA/Prc
MSATIRLTQFGEQTASDLDDAMRKAVSKGAESLVLDLRDNPGGLLDQAVHVCEKFLPPGNWSFRPKVAMESRKPCTTEKAAASCPPCPSSCWS